MDEHVELRRGAYHDSVTLMQVSAAVRQVAGVRAALVAMATELNLEVLRGMGFSPPEGASPSDLLLAVRSDDADARAAALAEVEVALAAGRAGGDGFGEGPPPRTVGAAADGADLAFVSVPGEHAYLEALDALRAGLHVLVFSDNVPLDQEVALKREGARRGRLVLGPDAGTAIVAGVGLGFANVVRPGPVGLVAASGTGAQQLTCLLDDAGIGIAHVLGVGGRDLSSAVGGVSTRQALAALDADPATELIVLLSKPPDPAVGEEVAAFASTLSTPVVTALLGRGQDDLTTVAGRVARALGRSLAPPASWPAPRERHRGHAELRGLFAGGTLCDEAMVLAAAALGPIRSNVPLEPSWRLPAGLDALDTPGHLLVDLGEDEFTRGRPHPMIDPSLRIERLAAEAARPGSRVVLLDVVLGHAADPDPAAALAPAVTDAIRTGEDLAVVVSLCATAADPQGRDRQARALVDAGASVHLSNADAARTAIALVGGGTS